MVRRIRSGYGCPSYSKAGSTGVGSEGVHCRGADLGQVARTQQNPGPARTDRLDRERVIVVQANTQGRPLSEAVVDIETWLAPILQRLPAGYTSTQGGETVDQREAVRRSERRYVSTAAPR